MSPRRRIRCSNCAFVFKTTRGVKYHQTRYNCKPMQQMRQCETGALEVLACANVSSQVHAAQAATRTIVGEMKEDLIIDECDNGSQDAFQVPFQLPCDSVENMDVEEDETTPRGSHIGEGDAESWYMDTDRDVDWKMVLARRCNVRPGVYRHAFFTSLRWEAARRTGRHGQTRFVNQEIRKNSKLGCLRFLRAPDTIDRHIHQAFDCPRALVDLEAPAWVRNVLDDPSGKVEIAMISSIWGAIKEMAIIAKAPWTRSFQRSPIASELWHGCIWRELEYQARRDHPETGGSVAPVVLFIDGTMVTRSLSKTPIVVEPAWIGERARRSGFFCSIVAVVPQLKFRRPDGMSLCNFTKQCRSASRWLAGASLAAVCKQLCGVRELSGRPVLVKALFVAVDSKEGHGLAHVFTGGRSARPCRACLVPFDQTNYFGPGSWAFAHCTDDAIAVAARTPRAVNTTFTEASQHAGEPVLNDRTFFARPGPAAVPYDMLHTICDHAKIAVSWTFQLARFRNPRDNTRSVEELDDTLRCLWPQNPVPEGWMRWRSVARAGLSDISRGSRGCDINDAFLDSRDRPSIALQVFLALLVRPQLLSKSRHGAAAFDREVAMSALWGAVGLHLDSHRRGWTQELRVALRESARLSAAHLTDLWARQQAVRKQDRKLLSKIKIHAGLHLPEAIRTFGTALAVDTDKWEGNHSLFKTAWTRVAKAQQRDESLSSLAVLGKATQELGLAWIAKQEGTSYPAEPPGEIPGSGHPVRVKPSLFGAKRTLPAKRLAQLIPAGSDAQSTMMDLLSSECGYRGSATGDDDVELLPWVTLRWYDGNQATLHAASHGSETHPAAYNDNESEAGHEAMDNATDKHRGRRSAMSVFLDGDATATQPFHVHLLVRIESRVFALGFYLAPIGLSPATNACVVRPHEMPNGWEEVMYERTLVGPQRRAVARLCAVSMESVDGPACLIHLRRRGDHYSAERSSALAFHGLHIPRSFFLRGTSDGITEPCAAWTALKSDAPSPGDLYKAFVEGSCVSGNESEAKSDDGTAVDDSDGGLLTRGRSNINASYESADESDSDVSVESDDSGAVRLSGIYWASAQEFLDIAIPRTQQSQELVGWRGVYKGSTGYLFEGTIIGCASGPRSRMPEYTRLVVELAIGRRTWVTDFPGGIRAFKIPPRWHKADGAVVVGFFDYKDEEGKARTDVRVEGRVSVEHFKKIKRCNGRSTTCLSPTFTVRWDDGTTTTEVGLDWVDAHTTSSLQFEEDVLSLLQDEARNTVSHDGQ